MQSFSFEFDEPREWRQFKDGNRLVFQGPNAEELIVSGASTSGSGSQADYRMMLQALHANAISAMKRAANMPELIVEEPLHEETTVTGLRCWIIKARSTDDQVVFDQVAVLSDTGALLLTFEAPPSARAAHTFEQLWSHVRAAGEEVRA